MGCGRVGARLATILDAEGHKVTILDIEPYSFRQLPADFNGTAMAGIGFNEDSLRKAKIEHADVFVAVTQDDNRNVMAAQIAKHIFNVPTVVCRIYDPIREEMYHDMGLNTVSPTKAVTELLLKAIKG
jgi:trk system potassium uptake protein TrkA